MLVSPVSVQDKLETFVPYRVVPQAPCDDERQAGATCDSEARH